MENAIAIYAIFKLGSILVPLNPTFNAWQVISALRHVQASHFIIGAGTNLPGKPIRENLTLLQQIVPDLEAHKVQSEVVPSLQNIILVENCQASFQSSSLRSLTSYPELLSSHSSSTTLNVSTQHPDDVINIQFTSGTTSAPKAASLSHRSILNNGFSIGERMLLTTKDVICCPPPLFHCFGSVLGYMASATHASCIVFPFESFDPHATLKSVQEENCTALYGVPTMFISELELIQSGDVKREGFQHLRTGIAAGSSIPAELMRKLHNVLNLTDLTICYGMTETSPVSAMTTTNDPMDSRINSVGKPLPHVQCKVVDPVDRSRTLPVGQRGELAVSGYLVMQGYWNDSARTAEVMLPDEKGNVWMHTGDEAVMDSEGYITITGRIKDIIIRGGENIHPLEVENCILAHPNVQEVAVVGLPDMKYGEVVAAFIVRRAGHGVSAEELREWVAKRLSRHLVPKHVFWTENYPKTASGKIQKFKLRDQGVQLLKQEQQSVEDGAIDHV